MDVVGRQLLQFCFTVLLARLLLPEHFGTVALAYLFVGMGAAVAECGIQTALIQRQDLTHSDLSTAFWLSLTVSAVTCGVMVAFTHVLNSVYGHQLLAEVIRLLSFVLVINSIGTVQISLLSKDLSFRKLATAGTTSAFLSGTLAVVFAWNGFGVWALVAQSLSFSVVNTIFVWRAHHWRPSLTISFYSVKQLIDFGRFVVGANLLEAAYSRVHSLVIGASYGMRDVGFYDRADTSKQLPASALSTLMVRVAFPLFASAKEEKTQLRSSLRTGIRMAIVVSMPMMLGLAALSENFILTIFGPRWLPSSALLQILCMAGALWPIHALNLHALIAAGHAHLYVRIEVLKKSFGFLALLIASFHSLQAIAWAQLTYSIFAFFLNTHYTGIHLGYGTLAQFQDSRAITLISLLMAGVVWTLSIYWPGSGPFELLALAALGVLIFVSMCVVGRATAFLDAVRYVGDWMRSLSHGGRRLS